MSTTRIHNFADDGVPHPPRTYPLTKRRAAIGSAALALVAVCLYRILTFVPQPLDAPGTLRPLVYRVFRLLLSRYPTPELAQHAWSTVCVLLLCIPAILAFAAYFRHTPGRSKHLLSRIVFSDWLFFAAIAACLFACRFPVLLVGEINPDETMFIAAAQKLFRDPVFYRAVDFVSSGPLNIYPLMVPAIFGISPDYVSTRLVAILILVAAVYVLYRALRLFANAPLARIALLPAAGVFAVMKYSDFLHCSSEHVSILLLSLTIYLTATTFCGQPPHQLRLAGLGLLVAAAFLAKMQAVPILGCAALITIVYVYRAKVGRPAWRPFGWVAAGLAPLLVLNAIICIAAGVWHDFWMEYIKGNYSYVDAQAQGSVSSLVARFADFVVSVADIRLLASAVLASCAAYCYYRRHRGQIGDIELFLRTGVLGGVVAVVTNWLLAAAGGANLGYAALMASAMVVSSFVLLYRDPGGLPPAVGWFGLVTAAILTAAVMAAYAPHRLYGHYLILLVLPCTAAMAWHVIAADRDAGDSRVSARADKSIAQAHASLPFLLAFATLTLSWQIYAVSSPDVVQFAYVPASIRPLEGELIEKLTTRADGIIVWGWTGAPYVGSARVSAVKDLLPIQLLEALVPNREVREYYRSTYLHNLQVRPPALFVDAIDASNGGFANRGAYGFQTIPEIAAFIQSHYVHVVDAYKERFYIRRDLARRAAGIPESRQCASDAIRCFEAGPASWVPPDLPPVRMPEHALVEAIFTPETRQDHFATVFSNDSGPDRPAGFQFFHENDDRYRLGVGWGVAGRISDQSVLLPQRKPVSLAMEFNGNLVALVCNGTQRIEMRLPQPVSDSTNPIVLGAWTGHQRPFLGNIQFFQIRDLGPARAQPSEALAQGRRPATGSR